MHVLNQIIYWFRFCLFMFSESLPIRTPSRLDEQHCLTPAYPAWLLEQPVQMQTIIIKHVAFVCFVLRLVWCFLVYLYLCHHASLSLSLLNCFLTGLCCFHKPSQWKYCPLICLLVLVETVFTKFYQSNFVCVVKFLSSTDFKQDNNDFQLFLVSRCNACWDVLGKFLFSVLLF